MLLRVDIAPVWHKNEVFGIKMKSPFTNYAVVFWLLSNESGVADSATHAARCPRPAFAISTGITVPSVLGSRFLRNNFKISPSPTLPLYQSKQKGSVDDDSEEMTTVGSSDYYKGFINRSMKEEPLERVTGDNLLGPILKFSGIAALCLVVLTVAFLASNDLL